MIQVTDKIEGMKVIKKKATPKQKARDILHGKLIDIYEGYWKEQDYITEGMTKREIELTQVQIEKEIEKILIKWKIW